jgi:hypothetical protein
MDIISEIFDHTDKRVESNMKQLAKIFNKNFGEDMNEGENSELKQLLDKDISYPIHYKPVITFMEQFLETLKKQQQSALQERLESSKPQGTIITYFGTEDLANTLADPVKIAETHNAFASYKKLGGEKKVQFLRYEVSKEAKFLSEVKRLRA